MGADWTEDGSAGRFFPLLSGMLVLQRCFLSQAAAVCTAHQVSFCHLILNSVAEGPFISGENMDTSSDLMLAQMLQMEFDREYDAQLRREEKKFNGDSKGTRPLSL